jgi:hypothetical protein
VFGTGLLPYKRIKFDTAPACAQETVFDDRGSEGAELRLAMAAEISNPWFRVIVPSTEAGTSSIGLPS